MEIKKRLIGQCLDPIQTNEERAVVDIDAFIRRILLFDTYILHSNNLREIAHLTKVFGYEGMLTLLKEKAFRIYCVPYSAMADISSLAEKEKGKPLPFNSYALSYMSIVGNSEPHTLYESNWDFIHTCLQDNVQNIPIKSLRNLPGQSSLKKTIKLKQAIVDSLIKTDIDIPQEAFLQMRSEIKYDFSTVKMAICIKLRELKGIEAKPTEFNLKIFQLDEGCVIGKDIFEVESNIQEIFKLDDLTTRKVISQGLLAIGGLNMRIGTMKAFSAISGFREDQLSIFNSKLEFIMRDFFSRP